MNSRITFKKNASVILSAAKNPLVLGRSFASLRMTTKIMFWFSICVAILAAVSCGGGVTETCNPTTVIMCPVGNTDDDSVIADELPIDEVPTGSVYCYDETADTQEACETAGGLWSLYADGCRDSCYAEYYGDAVECTTENTYGCNCGVDSCWDECSQTCAEIE